MTNEERSQTYSGRYIENTKGLMGEINANIIELKTQLDVCMAERGELQAQVADLMAQVAKLTPDPVVPVAPAVPAP